jgi:hypothetical protein
MTGRGPIVARLDHVAVAAETRAELWPRYATELGGRWYGGGGTMGFTTGQLMYANGVKVEAIEPYRVEQDDFLRRFLDKFGPGTHHITFKVEDLAGGVELVRRRGLEPATVRVDSPTWREVFFRPSDGGGIVVQLTERIGGRDPRRPPKSLPAPPPFEAATLDRVVHVVADLVPVRLLFQELLGGEPSPADAATAREVDGVDEGDVEALELIWPAGGCIRFLHPTGPGPMADWLGDRRGRVHHLAFTTAQPERAAGVRPALGEWYEVPAEANRGVRLQLRHA